MMGHKVSDEAKISIEVKGCDESQRSNEAN